MSFRKLGMQISAAITEKIYIYLWVGQYPRSRNENDIYTHARSEKKRFYL